MANQREDEIIFSEFNPEFLRRKQAEEKRQKALEEKRKRRILILKIALVAIVVLAGYLCLDISKVREIHFEGNPYLAKDYLMDLAGVNVNSRWMFISPSYISARLSSNSLIDSSEVVLDDDHTLRIKLNMKQALGYYWVEDQPYIILDDAREIPLDRELYSAMTSIPFIRDLYTDQQKIDLINELRHLDSEVIYAISEIWPFVESYDPYMYRFIMSDGNQVFMSKEGIKLMRSYYGIASSVGSTNVCLMMNEETNSAYTRSCAELNEDEAQVVASWQQEDTTNEENNNEEVINEEEGENSNEEVSENNSEEVESQNSEENTETENQDSVEEQQGNDSE